MGGDALELLGSPPPSLGIGDDHVVDCVFQVGERGVEGAREVGMAWPQAGDVVAVRAFEPHRRIDADWQARPTERRLEIYLGDYVDRGPDSAAVIEPAKGVAPALLISAHLESSIAI